MIPKIIHYCWFGRGNKTKLALKCIASWKRFCPDYRIIEWNEDNCDLVSAPPFARQSYEAGKYAFTSDYFRLKVVYEYGGIYLDTDVELIKSPDSLLVNHAYFGIEDYSINTGLGFGAEKNAPILQELLQIYENIPFFKSDDTSDPIFSPVRDTPVFIRHGFNWADNDSEQTLDDDKIHIYPTEYFSPKRWNSFLSRITRNTISIHHYAGSWISPKKKHEIMIAKLQNLVVTLPKYIVWLIIGEDRYRRLKEWLHRKK